MKKEKQRMEYKYVGLLHQSFWLKLVYGIVHVYLSSIVDCSWFVAFWEHQMFRL